MLAQAAGIILSLGIFAASAAAQDGERSWDNLTGLQPGHKIQVVEQNLRSRDGEFVSVSDAAIVFRVQQDDVTIPRADVFRISSREHSNRLRNTLIGLGIGAGAGAAVGFGILAATGGSDFPSAVIGPAVGAGAAAGMALGAVMPGYRATYQAERRQQPTERR
jgi:hypothetical protein